MVSESDEFVYDTVGMGPAEYAHIEVPPVKTPKTPPLNLHRILNSLPGADREERRKYLHSRMALLTEMERNSLQHKWSFWARDNQIAPSGDWTFWLLLAGRGFGKTRTGAEWVVSRVESGKSKRISLVAPTAADVRKVMVEGESGILAISPPWNRPMFEPSKLQITWPNGAIAQLFSAEEPERLRGPQCDTFWADELAAWKNMQETWDMLQFGFRLGTDPRGCVTTTPKPVTLLKQILGGEKSGETVVTRGSTYDNQGNLTQKFFSNVVKRYEGTRLGRQELDAEILEDMPGALWKRTDIDETRIPNTSILVPPVIERSVVPGIEDDVVDIDHLRRACRGILELVPEDLTRTIVSVDPNTSNNEGSDEIGITVAAKGVSGAGYVLLDASMKGTPSEWATTAILLHDAFLADRVIGEANQGGNMVEHTITSTAKHLKTVGHRNSDHIPVTLVHATKGKVTRAEPVSALYEQKRIHHVGTHSTLEDQMCLFTLDFDRKSMGYSPDRVDALVWALTALFLEESDTGILEFYREQHLQKIANKEKEADTSGYVEMKGPSHVSTVYGIDGTRYDVVNGSVWVKPGDIRGLRNGGFAEVLDK